LGFATLFAIFASFCWILRFSERVLTEDSEANEDFLTNFISYSDT
jgi:hypothetical protein